MEISRIFKQQIKYFNQVIEKNQLWLGRCMTVIQVVNFIGFTVIFTKFVLKSYLIPLFNFKNYLINLIEKSEETRLQLDSSFGQYFDSLIDLSLDRPDLHFFWPEVLNLEDLICFYQKSKKISSPIILGMLKHNNYLTPVFSLKLNLKSNISQNTRACTTIFILCEKSNGGLGWAQLQCGSEDMLLNEEITYSPNGFESTKRILFEGEESYLKNLKTLLDKGVVNHNGITFTFPNFQPRKKGIQTTLAKISHMLMYSRLNLNDYT